MLIVSGAVDAGRAADLATEVDRLALCIHRPTGRRPELMAALAPLGLPRHSIVVVAARFLAAGQMSTADLRSMSRYQADADTTKIVDSHIRRGLLARVGDDGDAFTPSPEFRAGARVVLDLQCEEAERLWSSMASLAAVAALARAHVEVALDSELSFDAFRRQVGVHHTLPPSDAGQLLGYLTEVRYLRSDTHALCLANEGLSGPSARTLHRLWRGFDAGGVIDRALVDSGLVDPDDDEPKPTARGVAMCERVEEATNALFASVFLPLDDERSSALLDGMRALAGEDPRPTEDR